MKPYSPLSLDCSSWANMAVTRNCTANLLRQKSLSVSVKSSRTHALHSQGNDEILHKQINKVQYRQRNEGYLIFKFCWFLLHYCFSMGVCVPLLLRNTKAFYGMGGHESQIFNLPDVLPRQTILFQIRLVWQFEKCVYLLWVGSKMRREQNSDERARLAVLHWFHVYVMLG